MLITTTELYTSNSNIRRFYCPFLSILCDLGASSRTGDWIFAKAPTARKTIGRTTKNTASNERMRPGVNSWYLARIPPSNAAFEGNGSTIVACLLFKDLLVPVNTIREVDEICARISVICWSVKYLNQLL